MRSVSRHSQPTVPANSRLTTGWAGRSIAAHCRRRHCVVSRVEASGLCAVTSRTFHGMVSGRSTRCRHAVNGSLDRIREYLLVSDGSAHRRLGCTAGYDTRLAALLPPAGPRTSRPGLSVSGSLGEDSTHVARPGAARGHAWRSVSTSIPLHTDENHSISLRSASLVFATDSFNRIDPLQSSALSLTSVSSAVVRQVRSNAAREGSRCAATASPQAARECCSTCCRRCGAARSARHIFRKASRPAPAIRLRSSATCHG